MHPIPRFEEDNTGYCPAMDPRTTRNWLGVVEFFQAEVPWELERLESLEHLVNSWPDWAATPSDAHGPSYSSLLRETFGPVQAPTGPESRV